MDNFIGWAVALAIVAGVVFTVNLWFPAPEIKGPCHEDNIAHYERWIKAHEMCLTTENCELSKSDFDAYFRHTDYLDTCRSNEN